MEWRLIESMPATGAENMAIDQVLLEAVQAGGPPALRFYRWTPACLSLGRNQPIRSPDMLAAAAAARGIDVVRRPTGGLAVLHDRELTYAVAVPVGVLGSPRESYRAVNRALVVGLRRLGVAAEVAGTGPAAAGVPGGWEAPCFQAAAPGEVVVGGRKLVGSAQRCERRTLLQHGSLLLEGGQEVVAEILGAARPSSRAALPLTTLAEARGTVPPLVDLVAALCAGFREILGIRLAPAPLSGDEAMRAAALTSHYRSPEWTWRRPCDPSTTERPAQPRSGRAAAPSRRR